MGPKRDIGEDFALSSNITSTLDVDASSGIMETRSLGGHTGNTSGSSSANRASEAIKLDSVERCISDEVGTSEGYSGSTSHSTVSGAHTLEKGGLGSLILNITEVESLSLVTVGDELGRA